MNDKKEELKKNLEHLEQHLQELKESNPDGEYQQLEEIINRFKQMLDGVDKKGFFWKSLLKSGLFLMILYFIYLISVGAMMGFSYSYLRIYNPIRLIYLIPIISVVLFGLHYFINIVVNHVFNKRTSLHFVFSNIFAIVLFAVIDYSFIHIYSNIYICLISLIGVSVLATIGEFYLSRKFLFW